MTAWCLLVQRSASCYSGRRQMSRAHSLCCCRACMTCLYRLETMATPRQGTVTAKCLFTHTDLEILFVFVDIPSETALVL